MLEQQLADYLIQYNQGHLVDHYDTLSHDQQALFLSQLKNLNLEMLSGLYHTLVKEPSEKSHKRLITPLKPDELALSEKTLYKEIGLKALSKGAVAVLLLAGGQGSRLGHEGPKGTFDIGLPSGKSLFELQADALKRTAKEAGKTIPWFIMTSEINHEETTRFFEAHQYFGLPMETIHFFSQGMLPAVDFDNKILLADQGELALSPDGNGGCLIALKRHGILDAMKEQGVKWLFLYGVDNAIVKMADPEFVGYTISSGKPAASKVVKKSHPDEKVGMLCYDHGKPAIVEYSEMSYEDNHLVNKDGELVYSAGNILNHLISLDALSAYMDKPLMYHLAKKKVPYIGPSGERIVPTEPNGYKYESFIFDLFPNLSDMAALLVARDQEFAPVKNATGEDSPETARNLFLSLNAQK